MHFLPDQLQGGGVLDGYLNQFFFKASPRYRTSDLVIAGSSSVTVNYFNWLGSSENLLIQVKVLLQLSKTDEGLQHSLLL